MESPVTFEVLVEDIRTERLDVVAQFFQTEHAALLALNWQPDAASLDTAELRFLLDYWHRLRDERALPSAEQVSPFDMRPALGHVAIIDALDEGRDGLYRLFGTKIALRLGDDLTGKRISQVDGGSYLSLFNRAVLRAIALRPEPIFVAHQPPASVSGTAWQWLVLPLARTGTAEVARYLIGMAAMSARPQA